MIIHLEQNTPAWLEFRRDKFNASEAGAVMGVGFVKPYELARQKYGGASVYVNEAMKEGHTYEPIIRQRLNDAYALSLAPTVMQSDEDGRFCASLDGYDEIDNSICEIKFSQNELDYVLAHNAPSPKYFYQIQHQFYVSKARRCLYAVGAHNPLATDADGLSIAVIEVAPDEDAINELKKAWQSFYDEYANLELDPQWLELACELRQANAQLKELEARTKELKSRLIELSGGKELKGAGVTVYKVNKAKSYDYAKYCQSINAQIPDEFARPASTSWSVRVS